MNDNVRLLFVLSLSKREVCIWIGSIKKFEFW